VRTDATKPTISCTHLEIGTDKIHFKRRKQKREKCYKIQTAKRNENKGREKEKKISKVNKKKTAERRHEQKLKNKYTMKKREEINKYSTDDTIPRSFTLPHTVATSQRIHLRAVCFDIARNVSPRPHEFQSTLQFAQRVE
jgi:hypothetical protein